MAYRGPKRELDLRVRLAGTTGYPRSFALLAQLVEHLHGKEGVDGSSPSEGSAKAAQIAAFRYVFSRREGR